MTDRGTNFTSRRFESFLKTFRIKQLLTSAYHPNANGKCEQTHKFFNNFTRQYILKHGKTTWDDGIPHLLSAHRCTPHASNRVAPAEAMLGWIPHSITGTNRFDNNRFLESNNWTTSLKNNYNYIQNYMERMMKEEQKRYKEEDDKRKRFLGEFKAEKKVLVESLNREKYEPLFREGKILEVLNNHAYLVGIKDALGLRQQKFHYDKIKI